MDERFEVLTVVLMTKQILGYGTVSLGLRPQGQEIHVFFLNCLTLKINTLWSFETMGTTCPKTQPHIPVDLHLIRLPRGSILSQCDQQPISCAFSTFKPLL